MSRTARLFQLMQALRSHTPPIRAETLAQDTGVSLRTIYRDVESLRGLGAVIEGEAGFGYTLQEDAHLPPLAFEEDELEALVLGLRDVEQVGDPALAEAARSALVKIRARVPERQARRLEHAVLSARRFKPLSEPTIDAATLRRAAWDERLVSFAYRDKGGSASARSVKPLAIVFMTNAHMLLAWCLLRQDFRAFRLDRMLELEVLEESFRPERVPLLREHLALIKAEYNSATNGQT
ncbi:YafY family transcriptional regulator [Lentibacter algarum]|uniref:helix-turn-helix transcriptional regulator n=1 Tax=Lentibacter algarum TaxID=576131 RepID=UPI001C0A0874|nr:YafY family protein [Lentibacter algarum]MBU2983069.1 YafY family transcriptional regulator [Lentibacter algarum]